MPEGQTRRCACVSDDPRDCYTLRYYHIAGCGAPSFEDDPGQCECHCHDNYDQYAWLDEVC